MINRFRQMHSQLRRIAVDKNIKIWRVKLWMDLFYSRLFAQLSFREYLNSAYRYNIFFRKNMMSTRNNRKINKIFNNEKDNFNSSNNHNDCIAFVILGACPVSPCAEIRERVTRGFFDGGVLRGREGNGA